MKKILIIDDDPMVLTTTKASLAAEGFQVFTAFNGEDGFEMAMKECPDLIIMDVMMPRENGIATLARLKREDKTKIIPVIISSNLEESYALVKNWGIAGFILKAKSSIIELVDKVKEVLG